MYNSMSNQRRRGGGGGEGEEEERKRKKEEERRRLTRSKAQKIFVNLTHHQRSYFLEQRI